MLFLKKFLLAFGAMFLIFAGGAGTQTHSTILQGGGFLGLIIGLVILYIFAKMAWRAMGCLPSILAILVIILFILYAIGAFSGGIGNVGRNLKSFMGQGSASGRMVQATAHQNSINLFDDEDLDIGIGESFPTVENQPVEEQQPETPEPQAGWLDKLLGSGKSEKKAAPNFNNLPVIYGAAEVVSGDTLRFEGRNFRLFGIDAPELNQACADYNGRSYSCGRQAAAWLNSWLQDNPLECRVMQQDAKGNMIGTCSLGAYDIGAALVNAGWAVVYTKHTDIYIPYQQQAEANGRGLWQGEFYMPWDWRKIQARKPNIKIIKQKPKRRRTILNPMG